MKTVYIDQILNGRTYPTQEILDAVSRISVAPFIKLSDKTILPDDGDLPPVRVAEFYCPECQKMFTVNSEYTYEAECPHCKSKRASYAIHCVNYEIKTPVTEEMSVKLIDDGYTWSGEKFHTNLIVDGTESSYRYRTMDIEQIFIVNKHIINGETFFSLANCPISIAYDYVNNTKELLIRRTNDVIILCDNEVLNIKSGRKSAASFLNSFSRYYSSNSEYVFGEEVVLEEFKDFMTNICENRLHYVPFTENKFEEYFLYLNLNALDGLRDALKNTPKPQKVYKRDLLAQEIIDNLQIPGSFTDTEKYIFFKITEKDEMNRTVSGEFTCPFCHQTTVVSDADSYFFTRESNFRECEHCKADFSTVEMINLSLINSTDKNVCLIQDYEDGLVVRSIPFKPVLTNNKLVYIPKTLDEKGTNIVIINKTNGSLSDILTLLSYNNEKGKYTFKKELNGLQNIGSDKIIVDAKNMNIQWSGVELLIKDSTVYRKAQFEENTIIKYLTLYQRYPVLEQILKAGYKDIVFNIISSYDWYSDMPNSLYDLSKKDIASALRLSKGCLKYIANNRRQVDDFRALQALYLVDNNISEEDFKYIISQNLPYHVVADICDSYGLTVHQVCEYIERVRINQCVFPTTAINEWRDYLAAIKLIGSDLSDRRVKYPAALRTEHDKVVYKKKIIENADFEASFKRITKEYGEKYSHAGSEFIITYPKTLNDLFEEGRLLNHCVGTYGDAIKDGRSIILFVRKKDTPKNPYFTIEVNPTHRSISQFLGFNDLPPSKRDDKKLIEFVKNWASSHGINY